MGKPTAPAPRRAIGLLLLCAFLLTGCTIAPEPLTDKQIKKRLQSDMEQAFMDQEPVGGPIDLYEAMARALKNNMDHRVKRMEDVLASETLRNVRLEMLPQLAASAGYTMRTNDEGSISRSLKTGFETTEPFGSRQRGWRSGNLSAVWNILDFGISYLQANQEADRLLISREQRRKVVQNIYQDVRHAFLRCVTADEILPEMDALLGSAQSALERSATMEQQQLQPPVKALEYQQALLETIRRLWDMRQDLVLAKTELASLMNLKPGEPYRLDGRTLVREPMPTLWDIRGLELVALHKRPELREADYQMRISILDIKKTMLRMLPGVEFAASIQHDSTRFLFNDTWGEAGMRVTGNLLNIFTSQDKIRLMETRTELAYVRRLGLSIAVITQLNLAYQRYLLAQRENIIAKRLEDVHRRKGQHLNAARQAATISDMDEIRQRTEALSARLQASISDAELNNAVGRVYHSLGLDPVPEVTDDLDILSLANTIRIHQAALFDRIQLAINTLDDNQSTDSPSPLSDRMAGSVEEFFNYPETEENTNWLLSIKEAWFPEWTGLPPGAIEQLEPEKAQRPKGRKSGNPTPPPARLAPPGQPLFQQQ